MAHLLPTIGALTFVAATMGCGGPAQPVPEHEDHASGATYGVRSARPLQPREAFEAIERLSPTRAVVMPSMRVHVVYIGRRGGDAAESFDSFASWLLGSEHWGVLAEYGVGRGTFVDSVYVPSDAFFDDQSLVDGMIGIDAFEALARRRMPLSEAAVGPMPDASVAELLPEAEAYVFFLPDGVDIGIGTRGTYTYRTCVDALGYHRFNGTEPYAVIGACPAGRSGFTVSHELAEMATDPVVGQGWYSRNDISQSGGEVADLCRLEGPVEVEGRSVTRFWSNARGRCLPH